MKERREGRKELWMEGMKAEKEIRAAAINKKGKT